MGKQTPFKIKIDQRSFNTKFDNTPPTTINLQSLDDTQVGYISQKYILDKYLIHFGKSI